MQHFGAFLIWLATNLILDVIITAIYFDLGEKRYMMKEPFAKITTLTAILSMMITCGIAVWQS